MQDNEMISHTIKNHTRFGYYCAKTNTITCGDKEYNSVHDFIYSHYMKFPYEIIPSSFVFSF
jgi:hypothetical protein